MEELVEQLCAENESIKARCKHYREECVAQKSLVAKERKNNKRLEKNAQKQKQKNDLLETNVAKLQALNDALLIKLKNATRELEQKDKQLHHFVHMGSVIQQTAIQYEQRNDVYSFVFAEARKDARTAAHLTSILENLEDHQEWRHLMK